VPDVRRAAVARDPEWHQLQVQARGADVEVRAMIFGPGFGYGAAAPESPALVECGADEATQVMLDTERGRFWAESWQGRLKRMREAGYVVAKVKA